MWIDAVPRGSYLSEASFSLGNFLYASWQLFRGATVFALACRAMVARHADVGEVLVPIHARLPTFALCSLASSSVSSRCSSSFVPSVPFRCVSCFSVEIS